MRKILILPFVALLASAFFGSCSSGTSYADQLDDEKALIKSYISREGINVMSSFPSDKKWGEKDFVKTSSGLYFHMLDSGEVNNIVLDTNDIVVPRYYECTLNNPCDTTIRNWTTQDYPYPATFVFGRSTGSCAAFREAVSYMKYLNSEALIIVPSKIGFYSTSSDVIPYLYHLKIKFQKPY